MKWFKLLLAFALGMILTFFFFSREEFIFMPHHIAKRDSIGFVGGGQIISDSMAKAIINNYQSENDLFPLRGGDGKSKLLGFYIDGKLLQAILDQKACQGVRLYIGKHTGSKRREFTTVFVGSWSHVGSKNPLMDNDSIGGIYVDFVDPCPTHCAR